ncbi:MAG: hypothetical protein JW854_08190 [Actinobacteria bacterium]|nr:hypothetical protein [Actinomycetota bacterium]
MTEAVASVSERMEFEIRGGPWEGIHAFIFYISVTCAVLATLGIMSTFLGISCVVLLFYSMFAIFSSPTYVIVDPTAQEITLEKYHYFIASQRRISREELKGLEVTESPRVPAAEGATSSKRDLSYYVRIYLRRRDGKSLKLFRSGMTGAPAENRIKAFLITQSVSHALDIPVLYTRRGMDKDDTEEGQGEESR